MPLFGLGCEFIGS